MQQCDPDEELLTQFIDFFFGSEFIEFWYDAQV